MAVFLVLGPSHWRSRRAGATPLEVRRRIARRLRDRGHVTVLLEDVKGRQADRDLMDTFRRVLAGATDVLVYHPPGAKMQATLHELLLLAAWEGPPRRVWLLVHPEAAELDGFQFKLKEAGLGSRYLDAVVRLRPVLLPWDNKRSLYKRVDHAAAEA